MPMPTPDGDVVAHPEDQPLKTMTRKKSVQIVFDGAVK